MSDKPKHEHQFETLRKPIWPWFLVSVIVFLSVGFVLWLIFAPKAEVQTDDARAVVHYTVVTPRVSAPIITVKVVDNQAVRAGEMLAELDPTDFDTAIANARATLEKDQAQANDVSASIDRQPSVIAQTQSSVPSAEARLELARANQKRYQNLAATGAGTDQNRQQAESSFKQAQSDLEGAQQGLVAAQHEVEVLKARRAAAMAQVRADRVVLRQAQINRSYTQIKAPIDGVVGQLSIQVGNYVTPASSLMSIVPLQDIYIEANYREVELQHVEAGQPVQIHVDAYDIDLNGKVDSIAPASGATFSAIPPENATGNFTKIVQRLTVKVVVNPNQPQTQLLRVGMNVETRIRTDLAAPTVRNAGVPPAVSK